MENPIVKPIGSDMLELDTPALVVDLDDLDFNFVINFCLVFLGLYFV